MTDLSLDHWLKLLTIFNKRKQRLDFFQPNPAQEHLWQLMQQHNRILVVKARQMGISTVCRAYHYLQAQMAQEPLTYAIISHTRDSAQHLSSIDKNFHRNLPKGLKPSLSQNTPRATKFADSGAAIRTYSAGGKGGTRSFTASAAHLSEFAFVDDPAELLAQVIASVGDGQIIIESTPNTPADLFATMVKQAQSGESEWKLAFYPWSWDPSYQAKMLRGDLLAHERKYAEIHDLTREQMYWRRKQINIMGSTKFRREYPQTIAEAFMGGAELFFQPEALDAIEVLRVPADRAHRPISDPDPNDGYVMGIDVGSGSGGDYSAITVLSMRTRQPVYHHLSNDIPPGRYAELALQVAAKYYQPKIILEAQNAGLVVQDRLELAGYPNIYRERASGYKTTGATRPLLFGGLQMAVDEGTLISADPILMEQLKQCVVINGRPDHPRGCHDDLMISTAMAYYLLDRTPISHVERNWTRSVIDEHKAKARARRARRSLPWDLRGKTRKRA